MKCTIDINKWGSFFSVPCAVADKHLKLSSGDFIKVLLCVFADGSPSVDTVYIAEKCGISDETAEEALLYWNSLGIIIINGKEEGRIKEHTEAKGSTTSHSSAEKKTVVRYSPTDLQKLAENSQDIRTMFSSVEKALERTINSSEQAAFVDIYEYYGFPVASVIMLTQYCSRIGKGTMAYIRSVAKNWNERGITSPKDVEREVIRLEEYHSFENEVKRALGLNSKTTKKQQEYFTQWQEKGISVELIEMAGEISIDNTDSHSIRLSYINKILHSWHEAGVKTVQQAQELLNSRKGGSTGGNTENGKSYDIEEFENFIKNYKPKLSTNN